MSPARTITVPTIGFGLVRPAAFAASRSARRMNRTSSPALMVRSLALAEAEPHLARLGLRLVASDVSDLTAQLPRELRARIGSLDDLERVVEFQNRFASPGRWMSPATVRRAAADNPEPKRLMLVVEDGSGALQAHGNVSDGGMWASPDGSWRLNLRVAAPWRRRGVGRALL